MTGFGPNSLKIEIEKNKNLLNKKLQKVYFV